MRVLSKLCPFEFEVRERSPTPARRGPLLKRVPSTPAAWQPEIAFCDLKNNMDCAEGYLRHCFRHVLESNADDLAFLEDFEEKKIKEDEKASPNGATADAEPKLRERLQVCSALSHPPFRS